MAENKWFNFYVSQFNTVEINETFHWLATEAKLLDWYIKTTKTSCLPVKFLSLSLILSN